MSDFETVTVLRICTNSLSSQCVGEGTKDVFIGSYCVFCHRIKHNQYHADYYNEKVKQNRPVAKRRVGRPKKIGCVNQKKPRGRPKKVNP
jgi:hypothetical protein